MYDVRAPYIFAEDNNTITGLTATPSAAAFRLANIPVRNVEVSTNRQLSVIKYNESMACGIGWFSIAQRQAVARFTKPIYQDRPLVVVSRIDADKVHLHTSLETLIADGALSLLVKTQYSYGSQIDAWLNKYEPNRSAVTLDNYGMLRMIDAKRANYMLMSFEEATHYITNAHFENAAALKFATLMDSPSGNLRHLMCSKSVPVEIIERLNAVIEGDIL
jgi:polar amino acid transport system substrate-binding protein